MGKRCEKSRGSMAQRASDIEVVWVYGYAAGIPRRPRCLGRQRMLAKTSGAASARKRPCQGSASPAAHRKAEKGEKFTR